MNIIFDLGGVVVTWEPDAIVARLIADPAARPIVRREIIGHPDWVELDRGTLAIADAVGRAVNRTGLPQAQVTEFFQRVPAQLVAIPETVELLYRLSAQGHALYCLSNMHFTSIEHLEKTYQFWEVFSGTVVSCRLKVCKPEPEIYAYLLETHGLAGTEMVFVDDLDENLATGAAFGMTPVKFYSAANCEEQLRGLGCFKNSGMT